MISLKEIITTLEEVKKKKKALSIAQEEYARQNSRVQGTVPLGSTQGSGIKGGYKANKQELLALLIDCDKEREEANRAYLSAVQAAEDYIKLLDDYTQRTIMRMHYIGGAEWEDVARRTYYSVRAIYKIRNNCLLSIQNKVNNTK